MAATKRTLPDKIWDYVQREYNPKYWDCVFEDIVRAFSSGEGLQTVWAQHALYDVNNQSDWEGAVLL